MGNSIGMNSNVTPSYINHHLVFLRKARPFFPSLSFEYNNEYDIGEYETDYASKPEEVEQKLYGISTRKLLNLC